MVQVSQLIERKAVKVAVGCNRRSGNPSSLFVCRPRFSVKKALGAVNVIAAIRPTDIALPG